MTSRLVFIDESIRSDRYLLCSVTVDGAEAGQLRREVRGLLLGGQRRLHFKLEGSAGVEPCSTSSSRWR